VDLGLFILGRAFDVMSKAYFVELAKGGKIKTNKGGVLSETDAQNSKMYDLSTRINLFVSNNILADEKSLHFLRQERNNPAHNIASLERRREMMTNASTYAKWYIEYVVLFEEKIAKIKSYS
jgi:hypothetical protein